MKKIINDPSTVVAESLKGLALAHADLLKVRHDPAVIYRADAPVPDKVSIISGGGSGHEPMHGGLVGLGMLDAAGRLLAVNAGRHLRTAAQMTRLFADQPEAIANSGRLAGRLGFTLQNLGYQFPDFPVEPGETMEGLLREQTRLGAHARFPAVTEAVARQRRVPDGRS